MAYHERWRWRPRDLRVPRRRHRRRPRASRSRWTSTRRSCTRYLRARTTRGRSGRRRCVRSRGGTLSAGFSWRARGSGRRSRRAQDRREDAVSTADCFKIEIDGDAGFVNPRPHVAEFLSHAGARFDLHVYSAATSLCAPRRAAPGQAAAHRPRAHSYVNAVLEHLDPSRRVFKVRRCSRAAASTSATNSSRTTGGALPRGVRLQAWRVLEGAWQRLRWCRGGGGQPDAVVCPARRTSSACSRRISRGACGGQPRVRARAGVHASAIARRCVLMDNNPIVFVHQPDNGIPITSYYDAPDDTALKQVSVCACVRVCVCVGGGGAAGGV